MSSVLGQNGEDDASPAEDLDTFTFEGKLGEKVKVKLGHDGSLGSAGEVATLRVRGQGAGVIGQRSGPVPLALELTLPGPVEITVLRTPGKGDAFRGFYALSVQLASGDIGERELDLPRMSSNRHPGGLDDQERRYNKDHAGRGRRRGRAPPSWPCRGGR